MARQKTRGVSLLHECRYEVLIYSEEEFKMKASSCGCGRKGECLRSCVVLAQTSGGTGSCGGAP